MPGYDIIPQQIQIVEVCSLLFTKDHKTRPLFNPLERFGKHRRARIENGWAQLFREQILPKLPVERIRPFYCGSKGAPTKDLYAMLGVLLLQQMHDLTDEETTDQVAFNVKWQYALNLSESNERELYVCPKTLWSFRNLLAVNNLSGTIFTTITDHLAQLFSVDPAHQRLDSVHVFSNMRRLGRVSLFVRTIKGFLVNLRRHHKERFSALPAELTGRYLDKSQESVFSMVKPSESEKTLSALGEDLLFLVETFVGEKAVSEMTSFRLLYRLFSEQCVAQSDPATRKKTFRVKTNQEIPSDSLQNPSDPDATYCGHKGQGFQAQIQETYVPLPPPVDGDTTREAEAPLRLALSVAVEQAHRSDAHALLPALADVTERGLAPQVLLADSLYGSEHNVAEAAAAGVEVVAPVPGGQREGKTFRLAEFSFTEEGGIALCPAGHVPASDSIVRKHREVVFSTAHCLGCPKRKGCPVKSVRKGYGFTYDQKQVRMARRRAREKTAEFADRYRHRSGVEATMSALDRLTGVKQLRVRGINAVRFAVTMKVLGLNIFRSAAFVRQKSKGKRHRNSSGLPLREAVIGLYAVCRRRWHLFLTHVATEPCFRFYPREIAA